MELPEFEKEERLQRHLLERRIDACDIADDGACRTLTQDAARLAHERFFRVRFGCFEGGAGCIVFVNMGPSNAAAREAFRRRLDALSVAELAVAVWPPREEPNAGYTWAVFVDDIDGDSLVAEAMAAWLGETDDGDRSP